MRSAESAMGVSGFLISCATRRATSCQAADFCARSSSLVSSSTTTKPEVSFSSSAETVTARCSLRLLGAQLDLARGGAGAAGALHQILDFGGILARKQVLEARGAGGLLGRENLGERAVDALDGAIGADGNDAGGDAFEDGFGEAAAAVELAAGASSSSVIRLKARTRSPNSSTARTSTRCCRLPLRTSLAAPKQSA